MKGFLDTLRSVGDHPLALAGFIAMVVVWVTLLIQTRKAGILFVAIRDLPEKDRLEEIRQAYGTYPPSDLPAIEWLISRRQRSADAAYGLWLFLVLAAVAMVIWLASFKGAKPH